MKRNAVYSTCSICGSPKGEACSYYTASYVKSNSVSSSGYYARTDTYAGLTKHNGSVCLKCRCRRNRTAFTVLAVIAGLLAVSLIVLSVIRFGPWDIQLSNDLLEWYKVNILFLCLSAAAAAGCLAPATGSETLIAYQKKKNKGSKLDYITDTQARQLKRVRR